MTDIDRCPFCGFQEPHLAVHPGVDGFRDRFSVLCDYRDGGCGADGPWRHSREEAVDAWNRRIAFSSEEGAERSKADVEKAFSWEKVAAVRRSDVGIEKTCRTCRWRSDEFTSACTNGDSINRADFVDAGDTCDEWEGLSRSIQTARCDADAAHKSYTPNKHRRRERGRLSVMPDMR